MPQGHAIVLDTHRGIATYVVLQMKHFCRLKASGNPFIDRRVTLRQICATAGIKARTFREAADIIQRDQDKIIERVAAKIARRRGEGAPEKAADSPS